MTNWNFKHGPQVAKSSLHAIRRCEPNTETKQRYREIEAKWYAWKHEAIMNPGYTAIRLVIRWTAILTLAFLVGYLMMEQMTNGSYQ